MPPHPRLPARSAGVLAALALATAPWSQALASPRAEVARRALPSAVRIQLVSPGGEVLRSASGIAVAGEGPSTFVLTNAHVVEPDRAWPAGVVVQVLPWPAQPAVRARVLARGRVPEEDLAVLEVEARLPVTPLGEDAPPELGEDLVVIGAPFGKGLSVSAGIVSAVEYDFAENAGTGGRARAIKTDAAIGYGSSGGGVFDVPGGRLVGLVESYRTARFSLGKERGATAVDLPMPGETFVAPAAKIRRFLEEHGLGQLGGPPSAGSGMAPAAVIAPARVRLGR